MNEIKLKESDVVVVGNSISFPAYQAYKTQALAIADFLNSTIVDADTVKSAKKMVAASRSAVKALDARRIEVKKQILQPYEIFADQVNELKYIVDDADRSVRAKIKEIDDAEKDQKKRQLHEIFEKRSFQYPVTDSIPNLWEKWLKITKINKTMSIRQYEREMTEFLEKVQTEWDTIESMDDRDDLEIAYIDHLNLVDAINSVELQKEVVKHLASVRDDEPSAAFVVTGAKDIKLAEALLRENGINFRRK